MESKSLKRKKKSQNVYTMLISCVVVIIGGGFNSFGVPVALLLLSVLFFPLFTFNTLDHDNGMFTVVYFAPTILFQ